ncbi:glycerol-3-phosphate 1-O-acyltransferase PlsY [Vaginisenegalia massiliensis]|uniref:glycerol-3-phosphate 1-O-acyltransferase PlsY n=1 Tax=Vaginisenegalia massiliensis TaxID=2058294 RepID=UPI000F540FAC|nr:glycerol-3-phosphate 1-O-acyltransferase PlsY [Vaginisenegalia massiliensis]
MLSYIIWPIVGYLAGSIPTGVWYSTYRHAVDVRELGSHNSGATNIGRNFGKKAAIFVTLVDLLKGAIPFYLAHHLYPQISLIWMSVALAAVLGHAYPLFADFRGGKVVATSIGILLAYHFTTGLIMVALFGLILWLSSTVSLASMLSYSLTSIGLLIFVNDKVVGIGFVLMALFMCYRHRANIGRLMMGNENRVGFGLRSRK